MRRFLWLIATLATWISLFVFLGYWIMSKQFIPSLELTTMIVGPPLFVLWSVYWGAVVAFRLRW